MVVWAAVLVPMWLRRHDAVTESRSVDRFSTAMRVLSRRPPYGGGTRYVMLPRLDQESPRISTSQRPSRGPAVELAASRCTPADARARLREQRQRVLAVLGAIFGVLSVMALAGAVGWGLVLLAGLILVGYVVHLRVQVLRAAAPAGARPGSLSRSDTRVDGSPATGSVDLAISTPSEEAPAPGPESAVEPSVNGQWEPVPVPLPTYVTAPVAPSPARREALLPPPTAEPFEPEDAEIEVLFERRWAVND